MIASGLSELELRSIVECAFLPSRCTCTIANQEMTVQINDLKSGRILHETGISLRRINTSRDISDLVARLRHGLSTAKVSHAHYNAA
ncbi:MULTISPECIES: DUF1652 domain-containing protein [Pseudomonas syringae group]|uniref:DUF1652 domain-containing protein n=2 Tax=Pseudomonas syringae group TaxID=136849 RepID=A0ABY1U9G4_PSESX|nr:MULTISPECIES: DUF1652 domain-containing protein [Pseudomonas syringae group]KWT08229.1 hypothetical protein AL046_21165 [Pseudomonas syringae pv. avii]PHN61476.1 hypothetical protein AO286_01030 [Pseudomonas syringae]POQ07519.1 DUF1652 domain-containing protein [Pseudomonas syringae pv. avii]RMR24736.1 hypothetical protein ALP89_04189 [Pseudomonas syringae pv. persicae]SOQ08598.1 hypothetical protein CFBP1573P_02072 [Pseudomonas syringae pv. persicae]